MNEQVLLLLGVISCWICLVASHGRLWDPPSRSSAWRRGFPTPVNYNDMELSCGGLEHQISQGYKCGLCGDPYDGVREHETGGKYATGTITKIYKQGQRINISVDLTAAHKGWFEFKICPRQRSTFKETQKCFDSHVLALADGSGTKFYIDKSRMYDIEVLLPEGLTCKFCVLQWRYHAGNNWGTDTDGESGLGLGYQEEFYGCADIRILRSRSGSDKHRRVRLPSSELQSFKRPSSESQSFKRPTSECKSFKQPTSESLSFKRPTSEFQSFKRPTSESLSFKQPTSESLSFKLPTSESLSFKRPTSESQSFKRPTSESLSFKRPTSESQSFKRPTSESQSFKRPTSESQSFKRPTSEPESLGSEESERDQDEEKICRATGIFATVPGLHKWCEDNCSRGHCPGSHCRCDE